MKKTIFVVIISALLLSLAVPAIAAPPKDNPGKGPPDLEKVVFIHYGNDFSPGKPAGTPGKGPVKDTELYSYSRVHWADSDIPVNYYINPAGQPVMTGSAAAGIKAAFQTWEDDPLSYIDFEYISDTGISPGIDVEAPDYTNVVGWADLSTIDSNAIGVTVTWYTRGRKLIVDCDVALNNNPDYAWIQFNEGDTWTDTENAYDVDVQNIMVHEVGHWLQLNDLYFDAASEQTMYGTASEFELKKRTLEEDGDIPGVREIYPLP